ncbi:RNA-binding protein MEX3A [Latimeria chalumnae]|uniref:RNA-binding protein MEX3A n=1 Tax=Latimeria chalumnae TaxID=7897 RepID=UPI0003C168E5|nr:PREDICTED: RNA-binding protein MEX3A [Latimeria chalumnae]|eukprot:XP_006000340.1 PREDICTED: RNA-binding protein MEX3A [Latimeria chalumnae]
MPSLIPSGMMERNGGFGDMGSGFRKDRVLEDERALQIALDQLCLLGLGGESEDSNNNNNNLEKEESKLCPVHKEADLKLRSSNTTECVPVPSSEHVAEIVGRQGCKIKALRAKTNTYIKTPVRGEEPVFMVTGRKEDVAMARREIISAAEHFSMIRASRNRSGMTFGTATLNLPGQTTIRVRVPYQVVGLVVGPKGATVKRIQQQTNTYIITPSRDRDPVFEITGTPASVERAREEIEAHIAMRTGKLLDFNNENDLFHDGADFSVENQNPDIWSTHTLAPGRKPLSGFLQNSSGCLGSSPVDSFYGTPNVTGQNDCNYTYLFSNFSVNKHASYFGVAEPSSPIWVNQDSTSALTGVHAGQQRSNSTGRVQPITRISPTQQESNLPGHSLARRAHSEPLHSFSKLTTPLPGGLSRASYAGGRDCVVCFESEVTAAMVPCGHNLFCMECAIRICEREEPKCPVCHAPITQAIRIFS